MPIPMILESGNEWLEYYKGTEIGAANVAAITSRAIDLSEITGFWVAI